MKIMMKDNWLGKKLNYPTNICTFAWGALWRLACVVAVGMFVIGYVWLWCMAFYDGFISGHDKAAVAATVWMILTVLAGVVVFATIRQITATISKATAAAARFIIASVWFIM